MKKLRQYQSRDKKDILEAFKKFNAVCYQAPTGSGKSVTTSELVDEFVKTADVLVLAHRKELLDQLEEHFQGLNLQTGKIIAKVERDTDNPVVVASINTVTLDKRLQTLLTRKKKFGWIVVDEAHRIASSSYEKVLEALRAANPNVKLLGITATPHRKDRVALSKYFDEIICSDSVAELIAAGHLAKYVTYSMPVKNLNEDVKKNSDDYQLTQLSKYMREEERIRYAVTSYRMRGEKKQFIAFCVDVEHGKAVAQAFRDSNEKEWFEAEELNEMAEEGMETEPDILTIGYLDGNTSEKDREAMLEAYAKGVLRGIVCIETLTEGVDLPETGCVILLRPTLSLTLYMQMVGRGLRPKKDGSKLIILDNAGCSKQFGLVSSPKKWSLTNDDPCSPSEGNKVVVRLKNGTYSENLDDIEFGELEEMTYEEYLDKVINSLEKAEEHNKDIDNKKVELLLHIADIFAKKLGNKKWFVKKPKENDNLREPKLEYTVNKEVYIMISLYGKDKISFSHRDYYVDGYKQKAEVAMAIGKLYEICLTDTDLVEKVVNIFQTIDGMDDKKINLHSLQQKQEKIKEEIFLSKLEEYLLQRDVLDFTKLKSHGEWGFRTSRFFQISWDNSRKWTDYFSTIKFADNKLKYSNEVTFFDKNGSVAYESKSVKKEKLIEILKGTSFEFN